MDRTAAPSQLKRAEPLRCAVATPADDAAIRRLLLENPIGGSVRLTFQREPDYFASANVALGEDQTTLVFSGTQLAAVGRCVRRQCWVDGKACTTGYLGELRLDSSAQGRFAILRDGYRFFQRLQSSNPADFYFTVIVSDNERARRVLESGFRGLPHYEFLADLTTLIVAVPPRPKRSSLRAVDANPGQIDRLLQLLNAHGQRHQLATVWREETLASLAAHGLPLDRFRIVVEGDEIIACGALWDQRAFRQTVIRGYSRAVTLARPLINVLSRLLGRPCLPRPGTTLPQALLSPLAVKPGYEEVLPDFIAEFFPLAAQLGLKFLTLALPSNDSRLRALQKRHRTRAWPSRLYRVQWPDQPGKPIEQIDKPFLPEIALL